MAAANFSIPPPAKFDLKAGNWDHWIKRYELFEAASERDRGGLSDKVRIRHGSHLANVWENLFTLR